MDEDIFVRDEVLDLVLKWSDNLEKIDRDLLELGGAVRGVDYAFDSVVKLRRGLTDIRRETSKLVKRISTIPEKFD